MQKIAVLGSTGSIGTQALDVISRHSDLFEVDALAASTSSEALFEQVRQFHPAMAGLRVEPEEIPEDLREGVQWFFGPDVLQQMARATQAEKVLVSVVGVVGLTAVMETLTCGKQVLLANKEPLVAGGELVTRTASAMGLPLLPVDSEHSAIFQCLQGAGGNVPVRLHLTASGGPFRTWAKEEIDRATKEQALRHPNWHMGQKITIDSATMINKALEVIEARWLFDMPVDKIEVLVHPQSVIHSMVEYEDGAVIAQLGTPDMRIPILYAMSWPRRLTTGGRPLNFLELSSLTFEAPDMEKFPGLRLGYEAIRTGGTMTTALNGANEVAVAAFLRDEITFGGIPRLVEETMQRSVPVFHPSLEEILEADRQARRTAQELLGTGRYGG